MKFKALGLTICVSFLTIFPSIKSSFAYFDNSKQQNIIDDICVGKWDVNKQSVSTSELNTFIGSANTIVNVNGQNYELSSYFRESLYFYKNQIQYPFTNYSVNEVENSYQSIMQNIQAFADIKNEKNIKLKENNQNYTDIDTKNLPKQGSSYIYYGYILTYDLSNKNNAPITLNIRMYSSSNEDLSNYAFELLLDSSVFSTSKPISYIYQIKEDNSVIDKITSPRSLDVFTSIIDDKSYDINGNKHQTNCPKLSGKWARFKDGNNQSNSGMIVNGSKKMVELSITLLSYNPINNKEISTIPFAISLSNCGKEQTSLKIGYQVYSGI